ncbi:hypothetical protein [Actinophytocola sp.]|uniref:hypothetical protein n=1 Tax=Actinophytocola sp. TaxID=1872138 RepID=UPI00389A7990
MALLRISAPAGSLPGPEEIEGLDIRVSTVERLAADRYQISGHGPESLIPELEARGCEVEVLMSTDEVEQFLSEVAAAVSPPDDEELGT